MTLSHGISAAVKVHQQCRLVGTVAAVHTCWSGVVQGLPAAACCCCTVILLYCDTAVLCTYFTDRAAPFESSTTMVQLYYCVQEVQLGW